MLYLFFSVELPWKRDNPNGLGQLQQRQLQLKVFGLEDFVREEFRTGAEGLTTCSFSFILLDVPVQEVMKSHHAS